MILATGLLVLAAGIVVLEILFPSFGVLGVAAATCYGFSLAHAFQVSAVWGWIFVGLGAVLLPSAIALALKIVPRTRMGRRLFLAAPTHDEIQRGVAPAADAGLVGRHGAAVTDLRPAGTAQIDGRRIDVVAASGAWVECGAAIRVVGVDGTRIVVDRAPVSGDP